MRNKKLWQQEAQHTDKWTHCQIKLLDNHITAQQRYECLNNVLKPLWIPLHGIWGPFRSRPLLSLMIKYLRCFCFLGCVASLRLMWVENSVKYLKPLAPQPRQLPLNPNMAMLVFSSGRYLLSTRATSVIPWSMGDLAPTRAKPSGISKFALEECERRSSPPAWHLPGEQYANSKNWVTIVTG